MLGALATVGLSPATAAVTDYPFRLVSQQAGAHYQVTAENDGPAPITVYATVALRGKNVALHGRWPMTATVSPHSTLVLGRVDAGVQAGASYEFLCQYNYHFGRADAVHDADAVYRLPFADGNGFTVSQAYGSKLSSHGDSENRYAVDFAMPVGSAVTAARAGVVIDVTLHHRKGGADPALRERANAVTIAHDDGTVAEYAHLSPGPAIVTARQRVAAGQLLGYSGSTGYTFGPHLHFSVRRASVNQGKVVHVSVPVQFYSKDPAQRFSARTGATVWANYGTTVTANSDSLPPPSPAADILEL